MCGGGVTVDVNVEFVKIVKYIVKMNSWGGVKGECERRIVVL